jgi:hypothetical protein
VSRTSPVTKQVDTVILNIFRVAYLGHSSVSAIFVIAFGGPFRRASRVERTARRPSEEDDLASFNEGPHGSRRNAAPIGVR